MSLGLDFGIVFKSQACTIFLEPNTEKNLRRIINPQKGFITDKSVYQRALPLDKPFLLEKMRKGLSPVAN
jgi:hypothetical protein